MNYELQSLSTEEQGLATGNVDYHRGQFIGTGNDEQMLAHTLKRKLSGEVELNSRKQMFTEKKSDVENEDFQIVNYHRRRPHHSKGDKNLGANDVISKENDRDDPGNKQEDKQNRRTTTFTSRTFVNEEFAAVNHHLKRTGKKNVNHQKETRSDINYQDETSSYAFKYAIDQHIPPLTIKCEPTTVDNNHAMKIIKELFLLIDEKFRKLNPKYEKTIGFDILLVY